MQLYHTLAIALAIPRGLCARFAVGRAMDFVERQVVASREAFYVFQSHDSAYARYFLSGRFQGAGMDPVDVRTDCVPDLQHPSGCAASGASNPAGTAVRLIFPKMASGEGGVEGGSEYSGIFFEQPKLTTPASKGYSLNGAGFRGFEAASPKAIRVRVEAGDAPTFYRNGLDLNSQWKRVRVPLTFGCCSDLRVPLIIAANGALTPEGGILLLRNIKLDRDVCLNPGDQSTPALSIRSNR